MANYRIKDAPNENTAPDGTEYILSDNASGVKKILLTNLLKIINALTAKTTPVAADLLPIYDVGGSTNKKITIAALLDKVGIVEDATPELGGALDCLGENITGAGNVDGNNWTGGVCFDHQTLAADTNLVMAKGDCVVEVTSGAVADNTITLPECSAVLGQIVIIY